MRALTIILSIVTLSIMSDVSVAVQKKTTQAKAKEFNWDSCMAELSYRGPSYAAAECQRKMKKNK